MTDIDVTPDNANDLYDYDVVIIGGGPGGYSTALRTADYGLSTAIIEKDATMGGTCLNRGCIPTKAYLHAAHILDSLDHAANWGITTNAPSIDIPALKQAKDKTVANTIKGLDGLLKARGVEVIHGVGRLDSAHRVTVESADDSNIPSARTITANHIVLATGSYATELKGFPFFSGNAADVDAAISAGQTPIISSDHALDISVPVKHVVIVGSGAIGLEFATYWNTLGVDVTLLVRRDSVLSAWDKHISATMMRHLKRRKITCVTNSSLVSVGHGEATYSTVDRSGASVTHTIPANLVLVAIGRSPATTASWFADSALACHDNGHVITDERGRTNLDNVWAVGDITSGDMLAHKAFEQALVISDAISGQCTHLKETATPRFSSIPRIVYGLVDAVSVGLTSQQAEELSHAADSTISDIQETVTPILSNPRVAMHGSTGTMVIVTGRDHKNPTNQRIVLGIHMVGSQVSELAHSARQIVENQLPLHQVAQALAPHPTISEILGEALLKADGRPLNLL